MMIRMLFIVTVICIPSVFHAQTGSSPYKGEEKRNIKALSEGEVEGYLNGDGMGFAKAAELNSYPGPKHVLQLAERLGITEQQLSQTQEIFDQMKEEATRLGILIVQKEKALDTFYAEQEMNAREMNRLVSEIARLNGELRFTHLVAHLKMKELLAPEQIRLYDSLRGYQEMDHTTHSHRH